MSIINHYSKTKQQVKIKSSINDANNCLNGIFPSFDSLNNEFCLGLTSHFSFHKADCHSNESKRAHCNKLDEIVFNASNIVIVVLDASIKDNPLLMYTPSATL